MGAYLENGRMPSRKLVTPSQKIVLPVGQNLPQAVQKFMQERRMRPLVNVNLQGDRRLRMANPRLVKATLSGSITGVQLYWNGGVVTQIPAGATFDVKVSFSGNNPNGGNWEVAVTAINPVDSSNAHGDVFSGSGTTMTGSFFLYDGISGNSNVFLAGQSSFTLRLTLWGNPVSEISWATFLSQVPKSQW